MICIPVALAGPGAFFILFIVACIFYNLGHDQKKQDREHREHEQERYLAKRASKPAVIWIAVAFTDRICQAELLEAFESENDALEFIYGVKVGGAHTFVARAPLHRQRINGNAT